MWDHLSQALMVFHLFSLQIEILKNMLIQVRLAVVFKHVNLLAVDVTTIAVLKS